MCLQLPKSILPLQSRGENLETGVWLNLPAAEGSPCCLVELVGRLPPHPSLTPGTLRAGLHGPLSPLLLYDGPGSLGSPALLSAWEDLEAHLVQHGQEKGGEPPDVQP